MNTIVEDGQVPPPGSESERELLKGYLIKVLNLVGARQLKVCWPKIPSKLDEQPLFVSKVAGVECGAVDESAQKVSTFVFNFYLVIL